MKLSRDSLRTLHAINYKVLYPPNSIYIYVYPLIHTTQTLPHTHTYAFGTHVHYADNAKVTEKKGALSLYTHIEKYCA